MAIENNLRLIPPKKVLKVIKEMSRLSQEPKKRVKQVDASWNMILTKDVSSILDDSVHGKLLVLQLANNCLNDSWTVSMIVARLRDKNSGERSILAVKERK